MQTLICPHCSKPIDANDALLAPLREQFKKEVEDKRHEYKQAFKRLEEQQEAFDKKMQEGINQALQEQKARLEAETSAQMAKERAKMQADIKAQMQAEQQNAFKAMEQELQEKSKQLQELHALQAKNARLEREKEEMKSKIEAESALNLTAQLEEEKAKLQAFFEVQFTQLKEENRKLKEGISQVNKRAELTSQQLQGEAQELAIEAYLKAQFPKDTIAEVPKGQKGADCLQKVHNERGVCCGVVCYESKRTKNFDHKWIAKLKANVLEAGAEVGVLVSEAMPKGLDRMGLLEGVWVCSFQEFKGLSVVLREMVVRLHGAYKSQENKADKMHYLYDYLTSQEFSQHVQGLVESFVALQRDLEDEKRAMERLWSKREKQIKKILSHVNKSYGSLEGIAGLDMPAMPALQLPAEG
ncbi:DUF2130 domain-containing protein [Helicobacter sp. NHP22-001]|uniref:DUF2130 domain-containing protein n=1 Tax=Helicobacter sp. NHP22-001 TaxID=3040202 RepID=UPI00244D935E|nr:DUF2130 domain-containing protein [Helicobacter sp. NHP22-001]GMB95418.1 Caldesmon [Helicobacter sp. NHP22-001]